MNTELIEYLKKEIKYCESEISSAIIEISKAETRRSCLSDRKLLLNHLLDLCLEKHNHGPLSF